MNTEIFKIAICDDEKAYRKQLMEAIQEYCRAQGKKVLISEYASGEECLTNMKDSEILFLDIDMEGMDGIEVKERLESARENILIVFITNYENRMDEAFGMQVISFLRKPIDMEMVKNVMDKISKWYSQKRYIELEGIDGKKNVFSIEQIVYIEASNQYCKIKFRQEELLQRKSLNAWEEELEGKYFCRIHQSVIVNFLHVKEVGQKVVMDDGTVFSVSIRRRKSVNEAYSNFIKSMLI